MELMTAVVADGGGCNCHDWSIRSHLMERKRVGTEATLNDVADRGSYATCLMGLRTGAEGRALSRLRAIRLDKVRNSCLLFSV